MLDNIGKNGLILGAFALVTTGMIALTNGLTEDKIKAQEQQQLMTTLDALIPVGSYNNDIHHDCGIISNAQFLGNDDPKHVYRARMDNQPVSLAIETTAPDGYNGNIKLLVGISGDGVTTGVRVIKHAETPGLGDKIELRISDWILSFDQMPLNSNNKELWAVKKDGGQFDQFTGATITPRAVVKAVRQAVEYYQANKQQLFDAPNQCLPQEGQ